MGGIASINEAGNKLDVHQQTDRAVIDWRDFDIGVDEHTEFHQPSANSIVLNRVNSHDPSQIMGKLSANGNVVLVNPNGVFFGKNAKVDVNGLIATTADTSNHDFMAGGDLHLDKTGNPSASITNEGTITAKEAGLVGLVAPNVLNHGLIEAKIGKVQLASGDSVTVDMHGHGLYELKVSDEVSSQLISNTGSIKAEGGVIALNAAAGKEIVNSLITIDGELKAPTIEQKNGKIIIAADGSNAVSGNNPEDKDNRRGQSTVKLTNAHLDASGQQVGQQGGSVTITADQIDLKNTSINASGHSKIDDTNINNGTATMTADKQVRSDAEFLAHGNRAGGSIKIGGDYLGKGDTATAKNVQIDADSVILNDAIANGDGGRTIIWSDDTTQFSGNLFARGGSESGSGGFIETSGKYKLTLDGRISAISHQGGKAGTWLLDPADIEITATTTANNSGTTPFAATAATSQVGADLIKAALDGGTDVSIVTSNDGFAGNGDITVNSAINTIGTGNLTLSSYRNIVQNANITLAGGDLLMRADNADTNSGSIFIGGNIATGGGDITMGGGSGAITAVSGYATGNAASSYVASYRGTGTGYGIGVAAGRNVDAGGGNIIMNGRGYATTTHGNYGVSLGLNANTIVKTSGGGNLTINGLAGGSGASNYNWGVGLEGSLQTEDGAILVNGTGGATTGSENLGIHMGYTTTNVLATGTGSVTMNGTGGSSSTSGGSTGIALRFFYGGKIGANGGAINLTGNGGGTTFGDHEGIGMGYGGAAIANTGNGIINITGTGGTGSSYQNNGVSIGDMTITGANGDITINGTGGDAGHGVNVGGANAVTSTGSGNIVVNGTAGGGYRGLWIQGANAFRNNGTGDMTLSGTASTGRGVAVTGNGSINGGGGAVTVNGTLTGSGVAAILVSGANAAITNSNNGTLTVNGTAAGTGSSRIGVQVDSGGTISTANGTLTVTGAGGGATTGANNYGVYVTGANSTIKTVGTGALNLTGTGGSAGGTGGSNYGVYSAIAGGITTTGGGALSVTGTGGNAGNASNHGIYASVANGITTSGAGSITLTGVRGGHASSYGIYNNLANGVTTTGTGDITLKTDTLFLNTANNINSAGSITIAPHSTGTMAVGTTGSTLNISDTYLGYLTAATSYIFGSTSASNLTINTAYNFLNAHLGFISGADINLTNTLSLSDDRNVTFTAGDDIATSATAGITTNRTTTGGNITFTASDDINIDHTLTLNAQNGGVVTLDASNGTVAMNTNLLLTNGDLTIRTDDLTGTLPNPGAGRFTYEQGTANKTLGIGTGGTSDISLSDSLITSIKNGFSSYVFGRLSDGGSVTNYTAAWEDPVTFLTNSHFTNSAAISSDDIILARAGGNVLLNADMTTSSSAANALVFAAGGNFINSAGGDALSATNSRWLVYSSDPANNTRDALLPTASEFNKTYASDAPATIVSGNRFLYATATQPTLTWNVNDNSVVHGGTYSGGSLTYVSGLLADDTVSNIGQTGNPAFGTTYTVGDIEAVYASALTATIGTLANPLGYLYSFNPGDLTVTAAPAGGGNFPVTTPVLTPEPEMPDPLPLPPVSPKPVEPTLPITELDESFTLPNTVIKSLQDPRLHLGSNGNVYTNNNLSLTGTIKTSVDAHDSQTASDDNSSNDEQFPLSTTSESAAETIKAFRGMVKVHPRLVQLFSLEEDWGAKY